jgi:hypothetical protein
MILTAQASRDFVDALLSAPVPNDALRAAANHYNRVVRSS